jgi:hypothetical protein
VTDRLLFREVLGLGSKEKEKVKDLFSKFPKGKGGNSGSFSHENKQHKDSGTPLCPEVRGLGGGPSALGRLPVSEINPPAPDKRVDRGV